MNFINMIARVPQLIGERERARETENKKLWLLDLATESIAPSEKFARCTGFSSRRHMIYILCERKQVKSILIWSDVVAIKCDYITMPFIWSPTVAEMHRW